jgi:putative nucleotidyltransferase with HDIG domain
MIQGISEDLRSTAEVMQQTSTGTNDAADAADAVARILAHVDDLPTLPTTVTQVLRLVDDPGCSVAALGKLVSGDPVLSARVLRLANSAYYGFPRAIAAVPQAITLLGLSTLRNVALSAGVFSMFRGGSARGTLDLWALWRHSVATAATAKLVARRAGYSPAEKAFTAGLLHDLGKLLIVRYLPGSLREILDLVAAENVAIGDAEQRVLGVSHPAFGAWLAARWNFPASLVDAIAFHHHPMHADDGQPLAGITSVADLLVRRAGIGSGGDDLAREMDPLVLQSLALTDADLDELADALAERRDDVEAFAASIGTH